MAKACLSNAYASEELFWKMEDTWVISSNVFSFLRDLITDYISTADISNGDISKPKPKPTTTHIKISDDN
jgi:hypothetical protein